MTDFKFNKEIPLMEQYNDFLNSLNKDQFDYYILMADLIRQEEKDILKSKINQEINKL